MMSTMVFINSGKVNLIERLSKEDMSKYQKAYILATVWHETGAKFHPITENLYYKTPERLKAVWPVRFRNLKEAEKYTNSPRELGNYVYGGKLGNNYLADGYTYRGRGYVQITGKVNYQKFAVLLDKDLVRDPELANDPDIAYTVLIRGIMEGLFTGRKLKDYVSGNKVDYVNARSVINADVKRVGQEIADKAKEFEELF